MFPILHDTGSDMDLSIVGRDDCSHMREEVELCSPFELIGKERAYILVSLPMIARWHSSKRFNAERILRQSGKFDYSEPQVFDVQIPNGKSYDLPGPLNLLDKNWCSYTMCEYESRHESHSFSLDCNTQNISVYEPSTLPCHMATVRVIIRPDEIDIMTFYGQLSRVFYANQKQIWSSRMLRRIQKILECGGDINNFLLSRQLYSAASYTSYDEDSFILTWSSYRRAHCFDLFRICRRMFENNFVYRCTTTFRFVGIYNYDGFREAYRFTCFLLRNGLFFFYISPFRNPEKSPDHWESESKNVNTSLLLPLFLKHLPMPERFLPFARGIAQQLLALGYGRRELHPAPLPLLDEQLDDTRRDLERFVELYQNECKSINVIELQSLVQHFREGPLSLQRLARVAVRRAVGGADFARQVRRLAGLIPPALVQYVADPTELMLSGEAVDRLCAAEERVDLRPLFGCNSSV